MAENQGKEDQGKPEEEKFDFTREGEVFGYISLDQARVLAMRTARETPGEYGSRFRNVPMAFEVAEDVETEDHYVVTLSFRPEGPFAGTPGREQFFIEKEGSVAVRQVLGFPTSGGIRRYLLNPVTIGAVVVAIAAVIGVVVATGGGGDGETPLAAVPPTSTPAPGASPAPPAPTTVPSATANPAITTASAVGAATAATEVPTSAPSVIPIATTTPTPGSTSGPTLVADPTPTPRGASACQTTGLSELSEQDFREVRNELPDRLPCLYQKPSTRFNRPGGIGFALRESDFDRISTRP